MKITHRVLRADRKPEEFSRGRALLAVSGLPVEDLDSDSVRLYGFYRGAELIGTGGFEVYGDVALLRSVAVEPSLRGQGVGRQLTDELLHLLDTSGVSTVYVLTETAVGFFEEYGFEEIDRTVLPAAIRGTGQFCRNCPSSSVAMWYQLNPQPEASHVSGR